MTLCTLFLLVPAKPHILYVLADDLGWGNVGWHRKAPPAEVQTPVLDGLVSAGIELNRFYTSQPPPLRLGTPWADARRQLARVLSDAELDPEWAAPDPRHGAQQQALRAFRSRC